MVDWFNQLKIQSKLFGIFGFIVFVGALTVGTGLFNVIHMGAEADDLLWQEQKLDDAHKTQAALYELDLAEKDYVLSGDRRYLNDHERYNAQIDLFLRKALLKADTEQEKKILDDLEHVKQEYEQNFAELVAAYNEGDSDRAVELSIEVSSKVIDGIWQQVDYIVVKGEDFLDERASQVHRHARTSTIIGVIALALFSALAIVAAVVIINQVNQPVLLLTDAVAAVEEHRFEPELLGELFKREDEMGQLARAFVNMTKAVRNREEDLRQQADQIRLKIEQQTGKD